MEIASYTSNIQPYGYSGGTEVASDSKGAKNTVTNQTVSADAQTKVAQVQNQKETPVKIQDNPTVDEIVEKRIQINKMELEKMVEQMNEFVNSVNKGLSFRIDEELGRNVVTIYEASSGEVIRQIPDEDMLVILKRLADRSSGFVEEKV
jgi:flagellar protein FlaG